MADVDESSSENNITVSGIVRFDASIHQINKNAYRVVVVKDLGSNNYRSRIGFNLGSLPIGYYTFVCEFYPFVMSNVSVTASGTTISINKQETKTFPTYTKTVVQFHRWNSTPPQFIYFDLHGSEPSNSRRMLAHIVVYGVEGYFTNVPSTVFDQIYMINDGRMLMQTDLDLNGHSIYEILNLSSGNILILKKINMNNKKIINVANGTDNNDVVNKKQMEDNSKLIEKKMVDNFKRIEKKIEDNLKHIVYGELNIHSVKFYLNGFSEIIMPYRNITTISFVYKTYNASPPPLESILPNIGVRIKAGNTLNFRSRAPGINQQINVNRTMTGNVLSIELSSGPRNNNGLSLDKILMRVEMAFRLP